MRLSWLAQTNRLLFTTRSVTYILLDDDATLQQWFEIYNLHLNNSLALCGEPWRSESDTKYKTSTRRHMFRNNKFRKAPNKMPI